MAKRRRFLVIFTIVILLIVFAGAAGLAWYTWRMIYCPNIDLHGKNTEFLFVRTGSGYEDLLEQFNTNKYLIHVGWFQWVAEKKKLSANVHPGRYLLHNGMSNNELINLLRSGMQEALNVTFNNIRLKEELAGAIFLQLESDSAELLLLLDDKSHAKKYGFTSENFLAMFIPNTYQFYWNTSAEEFIERMGKEYKKFWNDQRKQKANAIGITPIQVSVLASIVQKETQKNDEKPRVAGVYINRIKKGMFLQADPTLVFALKDFTIHRVLNIHKELDSPYNTYKYKGLPPGPICLPEISSLDAVLNYEPHEYFYFCAKEDFSGYHNFAKSFAQHCLNANKYQKELNKQKIFK